MDNAEKKERPASFRQLRTIDIWIRDGRKSKAAALREAGYSQSVIRQPHKVFGSTAVKRELERRGLGSDGTGYNKKQEKPRVIDIPQFDFSKMTMEQRKLLKKRLEEEVGYVHTPVREKEIPSYEPQGTGVDIFNAETKKRTDEDNNSNFSSM